MGIGTHGLDTTKLQEGMLQVRGHALRVLTGGAGARLVLVLASPVVHAGVYRRTAQAFARYGRVAVIDLPGSGWSSRVAKPLTMDELSRLLPDLLAALGERRCVLVGHSNSGAVALLAALRHPQCVSALVLTGSIGAHPSSSLLPIIAGRVIDGLIELRLTLTGWPAIALNLLRHPRNFFRQVGWAPGDGLLPEASRLRVPTVLAWGRRDHTMPMQAARRFERALPHCRLVVSESGSHDWNITQPQRFAGKVMEAIDDLQSAGELPTTSPDPPGAAAGT